MDSEYPKVAALAALRRHDAGALADVLELLPKSEFRRALDAVASGTERGSHMETAVQVAVLAFGIAEERLRRFSTPWFWSRQVGS